MFTQIRSRKKKKVIKRDIMRQVREISKARDQNQYKYKEGAAEFGAKVIDK